MSIDDVIAHVENDVVSILELSSGTTEKLKVRKVTTVLEAPFYMAYDFLNDAYVLSLKASEDIKAVAKEILNGTSKYSKRATKVLRALSEESGHRLRLMINDVARENLIRLSKLAREYLFNPINNLRENFMNYIKAVNYEESFAASVALKFLNKMGISEYNNKWSQKFSKIKDLATRFFSMPFEVLTHISGYLKAEREYTMSAGEFNKALFRTNYSQMKVPDVYIVHA